MRLPVDPYLDPVTGTLRTLLREGPPAASAAVEADLTTSRTIQLQTNGLVPHTRDLTELRALHKHIFQDIDEWAGEIRVTDMQRGDGKFFAPQQGIIVNANFVFAELHRREYLRGLDRDEFVHELARFYDELNYIHPFRDGNGRVQRLFWSRTALAAGWLLDWRPVYGPELNEVSRAAREEGELSGLKHALDRCIRPVANA